VPRVQVFIRSARAVSAVSSACLGQDEHPIVVWFACVIWAWSWTWLLCLIRGLWSLFKERKVKSGVKQFVHSVCLQTSVYDRGTTLFQMNVLFWTWVGIRTCSLAVLWLWIRQIVWNLVPSEHTHRGVRSVGVSGSETKLKIIPNRKFTVFSDVIMDTNNRNEELM